MATVWSSEVRARAWPAYLVTALAIAAFLWFALQQVPQSLQGEPDFPNYYLGGQRLLEGRPVYDDLGEEAAELFGSSDSEYPADPPATVVLLAPLSLLPYPVAWLAFAALSTALMTMIVYRVAREVGWPLPWALIAVSLALVSTNFRYLIRTNHMESLLLLAGYLGWRALRSGREGTGGFWWGVGAALKLFPGLWLVGLGAARRRRALLIGLGTALVIVILGVAAIGWEESRRFVVEVLPRSQRWYGALGNYSVMSFGTALVDEWFGWLLAALVAVLAGGWFLRTPGGPDRVWSAGTALALLLSPLAWHNYLILTFPILILLASQVDLSRPRTRLHLAVLVMGLAFWGPIVTSSETVSVLLSFVPTYALAGLFVWAMREGADRWTLEIPSLTSN